MANNPYVNKVIYNGDVKIDLTGVTVTADDVLNSKLVHLSTGEQVIGNGGCVVRVMAGNGNLIIPSGMATVTNGNLIFH